MATKKLPNNSSGTTSASTSMGEDFSADLIKQLNKEHGSNIAFNLGDGTSPTEVKRWISTGSRQLDSIISNRTKGGLPEGRIVEISGPSSGGKSHLAFEAAKATQQMGGIVVYIDTENATSLDNLKDIGIDVTKRFIFVQSGCIEEVFSVAESTILKARAMNKDVPVLIVWDSVAATSPKAELEGDYEQVTIGQAARVIGKSMRKIVQIIANQNVLFLLINQQRMKIGVSYGDPTTTPGGMAIPYACSTRIQITSTGQSHIKDAKGNIIGINVKAKTIKNKVAPPFRSVEFQIHFGKGVVEHEEVFDAFRLACEARKDTPIIVNDRIVTLEGTGAWKTFSLANAATGEFEKEVKFYKHEFGEKVLYKPEFAPYMEELYSAAFVTTYDKLKEHATYEGLNEDSYEEVYQAKIDQAEQMVLND